MNLPSDEVTKSTKNKLNKEQHNEGDDGDDDSGSGGGIEEGSINNGVTLFESNLRKDYSKDVPELNPEININFEAIFKQCTSNGLDDSVLTEEEDDLQNAR